MDREHHEDVGRVESRARRRRAGDHGTGTHRQWSRETQGSPADVDDWSVTGTKHTHQAGPKRGYSRTHGSGTRASAGRRRSERGWDLNADRTAFKSYR